MNQEDLKNFYFLLKSQSIEILQRYPVHSSINENVFKYDYLVEVSYGTLYTEDAS